MGNIVNFSKENYWQDKSTHDRILNIYSNIHFKHQLLFVLFFLQMLMWILTITKWPTTETFLSAPNFQYLFVSISFFRARFLTFFFYRGPKQFLSIRFLFRTNNCAIKWNYGHLPVLIQSTITSEMTSILESQSKEIWTKWLPLACLSISIIHFIIEIAYP